MLGEYQHPNNNIIAHRGAWKEFNLPQNSIASLKQAIKLGCFGSEVDVHLSADEIVVVNHDHTFHRKHIEKNLYTTLSEKKLSNGEQLPILKTCLNECLKQNQTKLIIEIKASEIYPERTLLLCKKVIELVNQKNAASLVEYISFDFDACLYLISRQPHAKVAYLSHDRNLNQLNDTNLYAISYHYKEFLKNISLVKEAQSLGFITKSWTVNNQKICKALKNKGLNYITTDKPLKFLKLTKIQLGSHRQSQLKQGE